MRTVPTLDLPGKLNHRTNTETSLKRTVFRNGTLYDAVSRTADSADIAVEDGWIVDVAAGLDGDEEVD